MAKSILKKVMVGTLIAATVVGGFFAVGGNVTVTKAATPNKAVVAAAVKDYTVKKTNKVMYAKQDLNMRKGPDTGYKAVGAVAGGHKVTVTGIAYKGNKKLNWSQMKYKGKNVYVCSSYLSNKKVKVVAQKKFAHKLTVKKANRTMYATQAVYLRAGASKQSKVLVVLKTNQKVKVVGDCYRGKTAAGWTKVTVKGKTGYVGTSFLKNKAAKKTVAKKAAKKTTFTVKKASATMYTNCNANFRKSPSAKAALKAIIKNGTKVKVNGVVYINHVKTNWVKITVKGATGYMFTGNLDF